MTNQNVYDTALRLVCEFDYDHANSDYRERAAYLLPVICQRFAPLDRVYRRATEQEEAISLSTAIYGLAEEFPLSDSFLAPAALLLASLLVVEENPALSERLERMIQPAINAIRSEIPCHIELIRNRYP